MTWVWSALIAIAVIGVCVGLSFTPEWAEAAVFVSFAFVLRVS